jgi:hypothetical protein
MSESIKPNPPVELETYSLTEDNAGNIVAQGFLATQSLERIGYDVYQRDLGTTAARRKLFVAARQGKPFPAVELGMRGVRTRDTSRGGILLLDPVYGIDGRQRIGTAIDFMGANLNSVVRVPATVHFNTTAVWERERFNELNLGQRRVSPSKLLSNERHLPAIGAIYGLTHSKDFALYNRVCWEQNMKRDELITARVLIMVAGTLHGHKVPSRRYSLQEGLLPGMDRVVRIFGVQALKDNMREFFDVVNEAWGCTDVTYRNGTTQLRGAFLMTLARILSDHHDFWKDDPTRGRDVRLVVDASYRARLKTIKLTDEVVRLVEGTIKSREILRLFIIGELNKGKQKKLRPRGDVKSVPVSREDMSSFMNAE